MSVINDIYNKYKNKCLTIPGFVVGQKEDVPYDITELANKYCQAIDDNDEIKKDQYISALMVRYWHMVVLTYNQSRSTRLELEDIASWIYEAIEKACKYRSWLDSSKAISKDPKGAEKVINRCIYSVRNYWYYVFNHDKRKINFKTYSLNETVSSDILDDGVEHTYIETLGEEDPAIKDYARDLVQKYINAGRISEAIVLDHIMYQDSFLDDSYTEKKEELDEEGKPIEINHYRLAFSSVKLFKMLRNIDFPVYKNYFTDVYNVNPEEFEATVTRLSGVSNPTLHRLVNKLFEELKENKEDLSWLCM